MRTNLTHGVIKQDGKPSSIKRSTTWKELSAAEQRELFDQASAVKIMVQHNSIIKRPVIETDKGLIVGFNKTEITKHLNLKT